MGEEQKADRLHGVVVSRVLKKVEAKYVASQSPFFETFYDSIYMLPSPTFIPQDLASSSFTSDNIKRLSHKTYIK